MLYKKGKGGNDPTDASVRNLLSHHLLPLYQDMWSSLSILLVSPGQEENKVKILPYIVLTPLSFGKEIRSSKAVAFLNDEPIIFVLF